MARMVFDGSSVAEPRSSCGAGGAGVSVGTGTGTGPLSGVAVALVAERGMVQSFLCMLSGAYPVLRFAARLRRMMEVAIL